MKINEFAKKYKTKEEAQLQMKITRSMLKIIGYCEEIK